MANDSKNQNEFNEYKNVTVGNTYVIGNEKYKVTENMIERNGEKIPVYQNTATGKTGVFLRSDEKGVYFRELTTTKWWEEDYGKNYIRGATVKKGTRVSSGFASTAIKNPAPTVRVGGTYLIGDEMYEVTTKKIEKNGAEIPIYKNTTTGKTGVFLRSDEKGVYFRELTTTDWWEEDYGKNYIRGTKVKNGEFVVAGPEAELIYPQQTSTEPESQPTEPESQPTEDPTPQVREYTNIDIEAAYKLSEFPQKFEIKYGESGDGKYGPHHLNYSAKNHIIKYITTYDYTPGQGKSAEQKATTFAKYIGKVKFILESDVLELSKTAVVKNNVGLGYSEVNNILDSMEETTPTIFRLYARSLPYLFSKITREQKNANKNKYESVKKIKEYTVKNYAAGITDEKVKERVLREAKIFITEIYDSKNSLLKRYKGYLTGKEYSSVTAAKSSKKRGKNNKHKNGIYVNIKNTEVIIDDLRITLDHIKKARVLIKEQVTTLNKKGAYNEYGFGVLKVEEVEGPLVELEKRIKNLKSKYETWLKLVKKYSGSGDDDRDKGGTTKTTPKTTPKTETPTVAPTETPTEQPTERPTEEVTQPTTPPTSTPVNPNPTPSGGGNSNGGGGNYSYTGDGGGETVTEAPTTVTEPTSEDVIVEGNSYKLPTSSKPSTTTTTTTNSGGGNSAIPVLAGLAAAAAAGIGAKAYIDRKNNRDNEEDGEFKAEDWSGDTDMSMEYQEPEDRNAETLDYDEPGYQEEETERYGARSNQDMENLQ